MKYGYILGIVGVIVVVILAFVWMNGKSTDSTTDISGQAIAPMKAKVNTTNTTGKAPNNTTTAGNTTGTTPSNTTTAGNTSGIPPSNTTTAGNTTETTPGNTTTGNTTSSNSTTNSTV